MRHVLEDGWYPLKSGGFVQMLGGRPVRIRDGGFNGCAVADVGDDTAEQRLLAEASLLTGTCLTYLAPFGPKLGKGQVADVDLSH